jgi:8-oxo-dGTP pyrophosphatase MutT (NUDIX family)
LTVSDDAIPAATLIVVRDRPGGPPELLMVERAGGMAFAAGAWVFPGGRIDEADRRLGEARGLDAAAVAALRETVEETAVPVGLSPTPDPARATALQDALVTDRPFEALLGEYGLEIDAGLLTPLARWVPRFHAVRRFDTLFFVARCPAGDWEPRVIEGECAAAAWLTAAELLERDDRGEARLIFPTRRNLERLAQHSSFDEIRADALAHPIEAVTPWVEERDGERFITIPGHLGYPVTQERLEGLWRG